MAFVTPAGLLGTILDGRYRLDSVAGQGGQGIVYRALHLTLGVPVAVKLLKAPLEYNPHARDTLVRRFRKEGRILFQLSSLHPAFVQAKEVGTVLDERRLDAEAAAQED